MRMEEMDWKLPWQRFEKEAELLGAQIELDTEVGPKHPLWGRQAQVVARRIDRDDILVRLGDGGFAVVHLLWHGKIDRYPEQYPSTRFLRDAGEFKTQMEMDADDYGEA